MKYLFYTTGIGLLLLQSGCTNEKGGSVSSHGVKTTSAGGYILNPNQLEIIYPETKKIDVVDDYFGTKVEDPYRWLENLDTSDAPKIDAWVEAQNNLARHYLKGIRYRDAIAERLRAIWNYEKYGTPMQEHGKFYYYKNDGLQNHSVLYRLDQLEGNAQVFLDPNSFSADGSVSMAGLWFSNNGKYVAYGTSGSGSDWTTVKVKDLATGKELSDVVEWVRYSGVAWAGDGFYYSRFDETSSGQKYTAKNEFHQVFYHKIGTPQSADQLVYMDRSQPSRKFSPATTEDERLLFVYASETTSGNALYFQRLTSKDAAIEPLITSFEHDFWVMDNTGDKVLVLTNYKAANRRLIEIDLNAPQEAKWRTVIPESNNVLEGVSIVGNRILAEYLQDASSKVAVYEMTGKLVGELAIPEEIGVGQGVPVTISGMSGKKKHDQAFFSVSSYTIPTTICRVDMKTLKTSVWKAPKMQFKVADYKTDQVTFKSKDGTEVRMFLTYKKNLPRNGQNPTLLYGYGGFNVSLTPGFSLSRIPFLEQGGIYAVVNLRGGGEYGEAWYEAGTKFKKQNVFDDFIAAAEYLIRENYTSSDKLGIEGGSNGGLLVGACMTQRPDLFQVAIPQVGVLDMLRYHRFTVGAAWARDYGTSDESKEMFENLYRYSPVHNATKNKYPATMIMTADHDDRVVPAHSYKFAAALQAAQEDNAPILLRVDTKAGHGAGKTTNMTIEENADKIAFLLFNMGVTELK